MLQSHGQAVADGWMGRCCDSVRAWAASCDFHYEYCDDGLFDLLPGIIRAKFSGQPVVLADLARLLWMAEKLDQGFDRAIWCDADVLVFKPFAISHPGDAFGRECWVQEHQGRLRAYRKIHNAFLQFSRGSATLPFYIDRATALLERAPAAVVPQFIGPKLLTAWHNIAPFSVEESVGMLSPLAMADLLGETDQALALLRRGHEKRLCALNLSASLQNQRIDGVVHGPGDYERLIGGLLQGDLAMRLTEGRGD